MEHDQEKEINEPQAEFEQLVRVFEKFADRFPAILNLDENYAGTPFDPIYSRLENEDWSSFSYEVYAWIEEEHLTLRVEHDASSAPDNPKVSRYSEEEQYTFRLAVDEESGDRSFHTEYICTTEKGYSKDSRSKKVIENYGPISGPVLNRLELLFDVDKFGRELEDNAPLDPFVPETGDG